ncbi:MAG: ABC transporter permease [Agathobacter sp.]|nr:ABC transporter permease [Agathobacter sp.]
MLLKENVILAITSLKSNKMRALLTMLGIIIGIGAVIAIFTVGNSLTISVEESLQSMGSNDVYVTVSGRSQEHDYSAVIDGVEYEVSDNDAEMTDGDYITGDMIHAMYERFQDDIYAINISHSVGSGTAQVADQTARVSLTGTSVGYFITSPIDIVAGSMLSQLDYENQNMACLVESGLVDDLFEGDVSAAVGNEIDVSLEESNITLTIVGVYESASTSGGGMSMFGFGGSTIYLPLKTAMAIDHAKDQYSVIRVSSAVGVDTEQLSKNIKSFYEPYYRNNTDFEVTVMTLESMIAMLTSLLDTITMAISIVAGIALLVGGIGVMNIMLVSVTERTREIGTRKALGAKNSSIRAQFIVEAIIICLIGGILGLILGITAGVMLSNYLGYPAMPSIGGIIISLVFSMGIGLFFGYFPANKAAQMNPIDALRYE